MGLFKKYTIFNDKINLVEHLFWAFNENNQNTIKEWNFESVENINEIEKFLEKLVEYDEECDIEIIQNENLYVNIKSTFDDFSFEFKCKNYSVNFREYNNQELIEIINNIQNQSLSNYEKIQELNTKLNDFKNYLNNEVSKKNTILTSEIKRESKLKSEIELNVLKKVICKLNL